MTKYTIVPAFPPKHSVDGGTKRSLLAGLPSKDHVLFLIFMLSTVLGQDGLKSAKKQALKFSKLRRKIGTDENLRN